MIILNGEELEIINFHSGEMNFKNYSPKEKINNVEFFYDAKEIYLLLMMLTDLRRTSEVTLFIPYLPYLREDRPIDNHLFTLKAFIESLNDLRLKEIVYFEGHVDVSKTLFRSRNILVSNVLFNIYHKDKFNVENDYIIFPDKGARARYSYEDFPDDVKFLVADKVRDENGKITSLDIKNLPDIKDAKCYIIDDLCCFGGTFLRVAEILKNAQCSEVHLCIGHAEPTIFKGDIFKSDLIDSVITTDSLLVSKKYDYDKLSICTCKSLYHEHLIDTWKYKTTFDIDKKGDDSNIHLNVTCMGETEDQCNKSIATMIVNENLEFDDLPSEINIDKDVIDLCKHFKTLKQLIDMYDVGPKCPILEDMSITKRKAIHKITFPYILNSKKRKP